MGVWIKNAYKEQRELPKRKAFPGGRKKSPPRSKRNFLVLLFLLPPPMYEKQRMGSLKSEFKAITKVYFFFDATWL